MEGNNNCQGEVFSADKDHLHHRLLRTGKSHRKVALTLYAINGCLVGAGLLSLAFNSLSLAIYLVAFVVATYVIVRHLAHVELWDSGMAVLQGLRRPPSKAVAVMGYPLLDLLILATTLWLSVYLTHPLTNHALRDLWFDHALMWLSAPFLCLAASGTYSRVWSRARPTEYLIMILALIGGFVLAAACNVFTTGRLTRLQLGEAGIFAGMTILGLIGLRIFPRFIQDGLPLLLRHRNIDGVPKIPTLVYGAGYSYTLFMRAKSHKALTQKIHRVVVGLLDDDTNLHGRTVYGCRVLGGIETLEAAILEYGAREIVITTFLEQPILQELERCAEKHKVHIFRWRTDIRSQQFAGIHFSFDHCLREITSRLLTTTPESLETDIAHILQLSATFAEADNCYAALFAPGTETLDKTFLWAAKDSQLRMNAVENMNTLSFPYLMEQLRAQRIVRIHDVAQLPKEAGIEKAFLQLRGVQSAIVVPIGHNGNLLGFMGYYGVHSNVIWEEEAVSLLKLQGDIVALALLRLQLPQGKG